VALCFGEKGILPLRHEVMKVYFKILRWFAFGGRETGKRRFEEFEKCYGIFCFIN